MSTENFFFYSLNSSKHNKLRLKFSPLWACCIELCIRMHCKLRFAHWARNFQSSSGCFYCCPTKSALVVACAIFPRCRASVPAHPLQSQHAIWSEREIFTCPEWKSMSHDFLALVRNFSSIEKAKYRKKFLFSFSPSAFPRLLIVTQSRCFSHCTSWETSHPR